MLSIDRFETMLADYDPANLPDELTPQRAAVAALLRGDDRGGVDVLLMKRVEDPGDRWSGQVALPGGRAQPGDGGDLLTTAVRETREEVGRSLERTARLIGRLDDVRARSRGGLLPLAIRPFVFCEVAREPVALGPEAAAALWLPLHRVLAGELDSTYAFDLDDGQVHFPCWRFQGHVVWGLTYRILGELLDLAYGAPSLRWGGG